MSVHQVDACVLCREIRKQAEGKWCFEWLSKLQEWQDLTERNKIEIHPHLSLNSTDEKVFSIRAKLANLQMQMPAWTLIDKIEKEAAELAVQGERELLLESIKTKTPNKCRKPLIEKKNELTIFVKDHILLMLNELYKQLFIEEKSITNPNRTIFRNFDGRVRIVGPVGERPLHVCVLSAYRFSLVDFGGAGNYMRDGILLGIQAYFEQNPVNVTHPAPVQGPPTLEDGNVDFEQFDVPYGKDYCAAVGSMLTIRSQQPSVLESDFLFSDMRHPQPSVHAPASTIPFEPELRLWHKYRSEQHPEQKCLSNISSNLFCWPANGNRQKVDKDNRQNLANVGVYEGETILFFMVAAGDKNSLRWALERAKDRQLLMQCEPDHDIFTIVARFSLPESSRVARPTKDTL